MQADIQIWTNGTIPFGNAEPGITINNSEILGERYIDVASTGGTPAHMR